MSAQTMREPVSPAPGLTERDLAFVIEAAAPDAKDPARLKRLLLEDPEFRKGLVGDPRVFRRVMADNDGFVRVSPALYFEILLRRTLEDLSATSHTFERSGTQTVVVFDTAQAASLLSLDGVLEYLADMLASFTRVRSYVTRVRVRRRLWRRTRFNDMDVDGLVRLCAQTDHAERFPLYKRVADVCLFTSGVFGEHASSDLRYASSGRRRPAVAGRTRRSAEDYMNEGSRAYRLAAEHETARLLGLSDVLMLLHRHFMAATKPLGFMSEHYLRFRRQRLFGAGAE